MSLEMWWPHLRQDSRDWLIAHNGEELSQPVIHDIQRVAGPVPAQAWWVGHAGRTSLQLSDAAVDWIEEVANGETAPTPT
ncbi:hypothetical protein [Kineococcus sp. NPDC059986]|jgi:hypothetical protein|uniref:hypothetical protein n=1 Tax=Kineococcus sp. NPDC059986 TaxID=3155538 RepID=UPI00344C4CDD